MPVVVCPNCRAKLTVKEEMLGKKGKCPKCAASIDLEAAGVSPIQAESPAPKPIPRRSSPPPLIAEAIEEGDERDVAAPSRRRARRRADEEDDHYDDRN